MTQATTKVRTILQDNYTKAQTRIVDLAEKAQASLRDGSVRTRERLEEVLAQYSLKELLERLKPVAGEMPLVTRAEFNQLKATVEGLREQLEDLEKKGPFGRKADLTKLTKRVSALEKTPSDS